MSKPILTSIMSSDQLLPKKAVYPGAEKHPGPNKRGGQTGPNRNPSVLLTPARKLKYVGQLSRSGRRVASAKAVGVSYASVCNHLKSDSAFEAAVEEAIEIYRDSIDEEVARRGMDGVKEAIYYQGEIVGHRTVYSDSLLMAHAKAHNPAYKDTIKVDKQITGSVTLGIETLSDEDRKNLKTLLESRQSPIDIPHEEITNNESDSNPAERRNGTGNDSG